MLSCAKGYSNPSSGSLPLISKVRNGLTIYSLGHDSSVAEVLARRQEYEAAGISDGTDSHFRPRAYFLGSLRRRSQPSVMIRLKPYRCGEFLRQLGNACMSLIKDSRKRRLILQESIYRGRLSGELGKLAWFEADFRQQGLTEEQKGGRETSDQPGFAIASQLHSGLRSIHPFHYCL